MSKYGKIVDGELIVMPWNTIHTVNGVGTVLNEPAALLALGYKQLVFTDPPECGEGYELSARWTEGDTTIVRTWEAVKVPADVTPSTEERLDALEAAMLELLGGMLDG